MRTSLDEDKVLPLTALQFQILVALAGGASYGYEIAETCARDSQGLLKPGGGATQASLKRLTSGGYIEFVGHQAGAGSPHKRSVYRLTLAGRTVLGWEAERLSKVAHLAKKRLNA